MSWKEKNELEKRHETFEKVIEKIRRAKKMHFYMKTGTMKLSTIHSFKGWEIPTLFLIINKNKDDNNKEQAINEELIYTGLTRARVNLIVINIGNKKYDNFFSKEIENIN